MESLIHIIKENSKKNASILELGCGNGNLVNAIAEHLPEAGRIVAVDYYNEPEQWNPNIEFIRQDLEQFDIPDMFDLVILNQVFEHIVNPLGLLLKSEDAESSRENLARRAESKWLQQ